MNEVIKALLERRSIKEYTSEQLTDEQLEQIIKCGLYAPNGMGAQAPVFIAVRDKKTRDELSKLNADVMGTSADPFYGAPCVVCVLADKNRSTAVEDASLAIGNMCLAAHSLGLGSCWIHRCRQVFESPQGKALLEKWGVKQDLIGVGFWILGHTKQINQPADRKENRGFSKD
jgi:nitroreductase